MFVFTPNRVHMENKLSIYSIKYIYWGTLEQFWCTESYLFEMLQVLQLSDLNMGIVLYSFDKHRVIGN